MKKYSLLSILDGLRVSKCSANFLNTRFLNKTFEWFQDFLLCFCGQNASVYASEDDRFIAILHACKWDYHKSFKVLNNTRVSK